MSICKVLRWTDRYLEPLVPLAGWSGAGTPESLELNQSIIRIALALASGIVLFGISYLIAVPNVLVVVFWSFLGYSLVHLAWVYFDPAPLRIRRAVTLMLDNLSTSFFAGYGSVFAIYAAIHFWTTVGYGLRFGRRYLFLASALAVLGMIYNVLRMPYWQANIAQGVLIIVALLAMTASTALVFRRINQVGAQLATQHAEVARLASHDPLTGLPNRRYLLERLSGAIAGAERTGTTFAVMLFDIDHFKNVNDECGHEVGDALLQQIARRIDQRVRAGDTLARLGGDEFVIFVDSIADHDEVASIATDVLEIVAGIDSVDSLVVRVTASVGIVICDATPTMAESVTSILQRADGAMYAAKRAGGNCFRF